MRFAIGFFILGIISAVHGAYGIAGITPATGKTLLLVFLILSAISFILSPWDGVK